MSDSLVEILKVVIELITAIAGIFLIPWLKEKLGEAKLDKITRFVKEAVYAAEQTITSSEEKKRYVINFLRKMKIELSEEQLDALIESAVKSLKLEQKKADGGEAR